MNFAQIPSGSSVFLDANTLVYYFSNHPAFGAVCEALLERIEQQDLQGFVSLHLLAEMAHRLMTIEACARFNWPTQGIALRLRNHPAEVQQLSRYRQALDEVTQFRIQVLTSASDAVSRAADVTRQHGLLMNDALIVVLMRDHGLTLLASNDADFDRIPGLTRCTPV
jgi:predicted nucleic acid-binding protein